MNNNELLVKSITLLYLESIYNKADNSSELIKTIINTIKVPDVSVALNHEREIIINLKNIVLRMIDNISNDVEYNLNELLQTIKLNCKEDILTYNAIELVIAKEYSKEELKKSINTIKKYFKSFFNLNEIKNTVKKLSTEVLYNNESKSTSEINSFVIEQIEILQELCKDTNKKIDAELVDLNNSDETGSLIDEEVNKNGNGGFVLKTGWKGLNRMLGGGFIRGQTIVIGALPHSNKTGFSLSLFRQIAVHNKPYLIDNTKKPLIIRISFEDSLTKNLHFLYNLCYENNTGLKSNIKEIPKNETGPFIKNCLQINGYHIKMSYIPNADIWNHTKIIDLCDRLISEGYEIHLLMIDYLSLTIPPERQKGAMGDAIRELFKKIRSYTLPRNITFITPHQLSPDAKRIKRDGFGDFVKRLPGGGFYQGCSSLSDPVDVELFIDIEKTDRKAFQTVQLGKNRANHIVAEKDKYLVLPFPDDGRPILDDIDKTYEISLDKPGGERLDKSNETNEDVLGF